MKSLMALALALMALVMVPPAFAAGPEAPPPLIVDEPASLAGLDCLGTSPELCPPPPGPWRLKPNAKWHLLGHGLAAPAWLMLHITVHEGSHSLAALAIGAEVTSFKPYPHMDAENGFYWGSMMCRKDGFSQGEDAFIMIAPYITDFALFAAADLTLTYGLNQDSAAAPFFLVGGMLVPFIDFAVNVNGLNNGGDWAKLSKLAGMPRWSTALIGDALLAVAAWRIFVQARDVFFTNAPLDLETPAIGVMPLVGPDYAGLGVIGRF